MRHSTFSTVKPDTLLSRGEEEALAQQREIVENGGLAWAAEVAARGGLADWEYDLLKVLDCALPEPTEPDPAVAERAVAEARRQIDRITTLRTRRAALVCALRSEASEVDLDEAQNLLELPRVREVGPVAWVDALLTVTGQQESGPLLRLMAGVKSVQERRDGNVEWRAESQPSREHAVLAVTAASESGCWRDRSWGLHSRLEVRQDAYSEVLVRPYGPGEGHSLVVHSAGVPGVSTTYRGEVVGEMVVRWWMSMNARKGVRDTVRQIGRRNREVGFALDAARHLQEAAARDEPTLVREAALVAEYLILEGSDGGLDENYVEQRMEEMWPHLRPRGDVLRLLVALGSIGSQLLRDLVPAQEPEGEESWVYWDRDRKLREVVRRMEK